MVPDAQPFFWGTPPGKTVGRLSLLATAAIAILLVAPAASAQAMEADCSAAPCGYINPIINLDFPEKLDCGVGNVLGAEPTPEDCMTPPATGESLVLDGTLQWYWDASYDGTYPADPSEPIEISFGQTSTHPGWIDFSIEPSGFTIDNTVLFDPQNFRPIVHDDNSVQAFFWYEEPVTITFTRTGEPTAEELEDMRNKDGVQPVFVKVKSTSSGTQYKEAYGIELFRFHAANDPELAPLVSHETPSPGLAFLLAAIGAAGVAARRRRLD